MKLVRLVLMIASGLMVLVPTPARAGGESIDVFDNGFDPQQTDKLLPDLPGDTPLPWMWCPDSGGTGVCAEGTDSPHNIREDHKLFYSGVAVSDRPDFERFFSAGKFRYYCELHGARRAAWTDWSA